MAKYFEDLENETEDVIKAQDLDDTQWSMAAWLDPESNFFSPKNFLRNNIIAAGGKNFTGWLEYPVRDAGREELTLKEERIVRIPSASIKNMICPLMDIRPEKGSTGKPFETLSIYGHALDNKDLLSSRIDDRLAGSFSRDGLTTRFEALEIYGAFENVASMKNTLKKLYSLVLEKNGMSKIRLNMASTCLDDEGSRHTLAWMVRTGYVEPLITDIPGQVSYDFRMFDTRMTARLYTIEDEPEKQRKKKKQKEDSDSKDIFRENGFDF